MFVLFGDAKKSLNAVDDDVCSLGGTLVPMDKIAVFLKEKTSKVVALPTKALIAGYENDLFISHHQATGADLATSLRFRLGQVGLYVLVDQMMSQITVQSMLDGVERSAGIVFLLTKGATARQFCQMELLKAVELPRPIVFAHEADTRVAGFAEIYDMKAETPADLQGLFNSIESIPFRRREYECEATVLDIKRRLLP